MKANKEALGLQRICLLAHDYLRSFYETAGFTCTGQSVVVHGSEPWLDFVQEL
eukprot:m.101112 g.101112  ORF g.101112 m.101112 type:complete len:53 (-) comp18705_c0_seq2:20-178(-)